MGAGSSTNGVVGDNQARDGDYLTHTPPQNERTWTLPQTLWGKKARLMGDWENIKKLDKQVLNVPRSMKPPLQVKPEILVKHLTRDAKTPVERLRVIVRWIGDNIEYDTRYLQDRSRSVDCSVQGVLRLGRTICSGYAAVMQELCKHADIECKTVVGLSKASGYYPGAINTDNPFTDHAWSMVRLGRTWYLIDATWIGGAVASDGPQVYKKYWCEWWFLCKPVQFQYMHLPILDNKPDTSAQLHSSLYTSVQRWDRTVARDPASVFFKIAPLSHKCAYVDTKKSQTMMVFSNPHHMDLVCRIKRTRIEGTARLTSDVDHKYYVMTYTLHGKTHMVLRLPGRGGYQVRVLGQIPSAEGDVLPKNGTFRVAMYQITNTDDTEPPRFPQALNNTWGPNQKFKSAGFELLRPNKTIMVKAKKGKAVVRIKLPSTKVLPQCFELTHCEFNGNSMLSTKCKDQVYGEREWDTATYYITCPKVGEYKFDVNFRFKKEGTTTSGYNEGLSILIRCKKECKQLLHISNGGVCAGPNFHFAKMGLRVSAKSSTLSVSMGKAVLRVIQDKELGLHASLEAIGISMNDIVSYLSEEKHGSMTVYTVRPQQPGMYMLKVYAAEVGRSSRTMAGMWLIPYKRSI